MSRETPEAVLAGMPGWEGAEWRQMPGGLTNRTWLIESATSRAVLKIDAAPRSVPFNARIEEQAIQQRAADAGLANPVVFASECVYLTEYVDGEVWPESHLRDDARLRELAIALRKLHGLPLTGRNFDAVEYARRYSRIVDSRHSGIAEHCVKIVRKLHAPQNICCCHNDLVAGNIISTPDVRFLDWEYACDNDPFFDLATVVAHHQLDERQARHLLECYFGGDGSRWYDKLQQQIRLYNALLWLWAAARPDAEEKSLADIASRLE